MAMIRPTRLPRAAADATPVRRHAALDDAVEGIDASQLDYLFAEGPTRRDLARAGVGEALARSRADGYDRDEVRAVLARKLCRLLPDLPPDRRDKAARHALRALDTLAQDHAATVRAALSTAIADIACAPPALANTLARDVERSVAEPVLRCCAALTDRDLLAIVAAREETWALVAIAARRFVSGSLSAALAGKNDAEATGVLLDNTGAVIAEPTLERLIDAAPRHPEWHLKLARRDGLPPRLAVRLAAHVDRSVMEVLCVRNDFDEATAREIARTARRRVDWAEERVPGETGDRRAERLFRSGDLDEIALGDAVSWGDGAFVRTALSLMAEVPRPAVESILESSDARAVTALCWRAGVSMRTAMQVQARASGVGPRQLLNARRGTDYPLSPGEMARVLELYGITIPAR
jgi:uncharacterized protein (DUF2336 family)